MLLQLFWGFQKVQSGSPRVGLDRACPAPLMCTGWTKITVRREHRGVALENIAGLRFARNYGGFFRDEIAEIYE